MKVLLRLSVLCLLLLTSCTSSELPGAEGFTASGTIVGGLRQIELDPGAASTGLHVYRGDYVKFVVKDGAQLRLVVEQLDIDETLPKSGEKPYVKFKQAGSFALTLDGVAGTVTVHEYKAENYTEITPKQATELIASVHPFVLDVRTKGEFDAGHLADAHLLPVKELQKRIHELDAQKELPMLVYCRSGNRSTVAAKLLLDAGFERVYNLRAGVKGWTAEQLPLVK